MKFFLLPFLLLSLLVNAQQKSHSNIKLSNETVNYLRSSADKYSKKYNSDYDIASKLYPKEITLKSGKIAKLYGTGSGNTPLYVATTNQGAVITARANYLYAESSLNLNLTGSGLTSGVWEGDFIRKTHESLVGRVSNVELGDFTSSNEETDHATHVSATIAGSGLNKVSARGLAFESDIVGYNWNNDTSEMASEAANGLLVSNHSYGLATFDYSGNLLVPVYYFGRYDLKSRQVDDIMFNSKYYQPVFSAGNDRRESSFGSNKSGYDMLAGKENSKNAIVVAAVNGVPNYTGPNDVQMSEFSNWGPTDDGRIKPDISAKGVGVYSASSSSDISYKNSNGTSMAAPVVTGTILLLQEHFYNENQFYMKSATVRGLLAHTADECDKNFFGADGPDYKYGWGLMNAKFAAETISNNGTSSIIIEGTLNENDVYEVDLEAIGGNNVIATLSWTDPAGTVYNSSLENMLDYSVPVLVNDLDLRVNDSQNTYFPWKLDPSSPGTPATQGDNLVDNIEKVEINDAYGSLNFKISHKGYLTNSAQEFTLIITGVDSSLSNYESDRQSQLRIWPNPTKNIVNFKFNNTNEPNSISLYDSSGKLVINKIDVNQSLHSLDISMLPKGFYLLDISIGFKKFSEKLILE